MVYSNLRDYEAKPYLLVLYVNPEDAYWQIALKNFLKHRCIKLVKKPLLLVVSTTPYRHHLKKSIAFFAPFYARPVSFLLCVYAIHPTHLNNIFFHCFSSHSLVRLFFGLERRVFFKLTLLPAFLFFGHELLIFMKPISDHWCTVRYATFTSATLSHWCTSLAS